MDYKTLKESSELVERIEKLPQFYSNKKEENLNEISKNKKNKIKKDAITSIWGGKNNVKTFLIITGENPMGEEGTNKLNRNRQKDLITYLRQGNYAWQPVTGKYNVVENSVIVFNINTNNSKIIAKDLEQESFIFGRKEDDKIAFDLYVFNKGTKKYDMVETKYDFDDAIDFIQNYTKIDNKHKFRIDFDYFKEACDKFNTIVNEQKEKSQKYRDNYDRFAEYLITEGKIGRNYFHACSLIYGKLFENNR